MPVPATKLHPPRPRRRLVQRARLLDRLHADGGETPRLVLVAAPAGFGKTTLLAQWLAAGENAQRRVAWLALDRGDADLRQFLTDLTAAIQTAEPEAGVDALIVTLGHDATAPIIGDLMLRREDGDVQAELRLDPRSHLLRPRLRHRSRTCAPPLLLPRPRAAPGHGELLPRRRLVLEAHGARRHAPRTARRPRLPAPIRPLADTVGYAILEDEWPPPRQT